MQEEKRENGTVSVARGTAIVGSLTLVSRVLGAIRDLLTARLFGASVIADSFFVAFRIPNLLRSFVAEGAMTSAFVPVFADELKKGQQDAASAMRAMSAFVWLATALLTLMGIVFAPRIVTLFAPGFGEGSPQTELCIELTRIMMPYIIFVSLVALMNGALSSVHIFGASAVAQAIMNLVLIAGALIAGLFEERAAVIVLALSVVAGGIVQILVQIPAMRRAGFTLLPGAGAFGRVVRHVVLLMIPAIIGATIYQISIFLNTMLASLLEVGSVSWLFYADRLAQLPIGIFSIALASVLLPTLSRAATDNDESRFTLNLGNSLRFTSFVIIPTSVALFFFAKPLVILLFERGAFDRVASLKTAIALQAMAVGLWGVSCHSMIVRAFIARKDTVTPTVIGLFTLMVSSFLALMLMGKPVQADGGALYEAVLSLQRKITSIAGFEGNLGHVGLALGTSFASFFSFGALAAVLWSRHRGMDWTPFLISTAKSFAASAGMLLFLYLIPFRELGALLTVCLGIPLAGAIYLIFCALLRSQEAGESLAVFAKRLGR